MKNVGERVLTSCSIIVKSAPAEFSISVKSMASLAHRASRKSNETTKVARRRQAGSPILSGFAIRRVRSRRS